MRSNVKGGSKVLEGGDNKIIGGTVSKRGEQLENGGEITV